MLNGRIVLDGSLMQIFSYLSPMLDHYVSLMDFVGHRKVFGKHLFSCHQKVIIKTCVNHLNGIPYLLMKLHVFWAYALGYLGLQ